MRRPTHRGFTLVELMIVIGIIGILSAVAIPGFVRYIRRSKTVEASMNVRRMYDSAVAYFQSERADAAGNIVPREFPPNTGWVPVQGACCAQAGQKCAPNSGLWNALGWTILNFSVDDPHYYSYNGLRSVGTGANAGDRFLAMASGDLNCNGLYSLFWRTATVGADRNILHGSGAMYDANAIE